jgi:hypothetical protein
MLPVLLKMFPVLLCSFLPHRLLYDGSREEGLLPAFARRIKKFSARHEPRSAAAVLVEGVHALLRLYDWWAWDRGRFYWRDGNVNVWG